MKKNLLKAMMALTLSIVALGACHEDESWEEENDKTMTIENAKTWYEANKPNPLSLRSSDQRPEVLMKPDWESAFTQSDKKYRVIESYLWTKGQLFFPQEDCFEKYKETQDKKYIQTLTRLVLLTEIGKNDTIGFLMTIAPSLDWLLATDFKPFENLTYLKRENKFSGQILYHNLNGEFVNGWQYKDGKVTATVTLINPEEAGSIALRGGSCYMVKYYSWEMECTDWYSAHDDRYLGTTCGSPYLVYDSFAVVCSDDGGGGYGGGGGGGGGGNPNPGPPTPSNRTDCPPSAVQNALEISNLLNNEDTDYQKVKKWVDILRGYAKKESNEYGISVSFATGQYFVLPNNDGNYYFVGNSNSAPQISTENTYLTAHTHPSGTNPAPSPSDAAYLGTSYKKNGATNITANVVIAADGSEYMVYVNDRNNFINFCNNSANSSFFVFNGALFPSGSTWAQTYDQVRNNLINAGYSQNDAQSYALSYVLDNFNTGMKIYKRESKFGDFKEQQTIKNGSNYQPKICQ